MNLAEPAPRVEGATADAAAYEEEAKASMVQQSEAPKVAAAAPVDPALVHDDPMHHAPASVKNPITGPTSSVSVAMLRGGSGADLECAAAVLRGAPEKNFLKVCLPCIYDERDFVTYGETKKYIMIKAGTCFVFGQESDPSPLYAIPLDDSIMAVKEDPDNPDPGSMTIDPLPNTNKQPKEIVTILLKYRTNGKQAYQFSFDTRTCDRSLPKRFMDLVEKSGSKSSKPVTASVVKANRVAKEKMKCQPDI